ncbi:MAG TPA: lipocalin-like domain-containing protein [Opitutaceae bacterium]|nr:lipocalin-like domain-containing protein [Opitutaceae bacterium]
MITSAFFISRKGAKAQTNRGFPALRLCAFARAFVLLVVCCIASVVTPARADDFANKFIGTWKLISTSEKNVATGKITPRAPSSGQLIYTPNGRLSVQIMKLDRPKVASGAFTTATPEEMKGALDGFSSYFGTWELVPSEGCMIHVQDGNLLPNGIGQRAKRYYSFDAAGHLSLTTPARKVGAEEIANIFTWERIP